MSVTLPSIHPRKCFCCKGDLHLNRVAYTCDNQSSEEFFIDDASLALAAGDRSPQWQLIDTAPVDGTKIDAWLEHKRNPANSHRMPNAFWSDKTNDWTWDGQWNGRVGPNWTVTHWMPRPPAPKVEA